MITKVYFILETEEDYNEVMDTIINSFPCFLDEEPIEFNYVEVTIKMREEDVASIEKILAKIV